jgi:cytochrome c oxidase subunit 2
MRLLDGIQSALNAQGPGAVVIAEMFWVMASGAAIIFAAVIALAAYALLAPRRTARRLSATALIVGGGIVVPVLTLSALLVYSLVRAGSLDPTAGRPLMRIEVIGEQWWWRVHYLDARGRPDFATANEIRIPVGEPIQLELQSADVIHSFWVPALAGKLDMIPGRTNRLRLQADRAGRYRGQCAEYCGGPHALMALVVIAESAEAFYRWLETQRRPAAPPAEALRQHGRDLFLAHCAVCHAVRGTAARGTRGPDLTHIGGRESIAAGLLPNNAATLAGWIASSQHLKPGNLMPAFTMLSGAELRAVAAYLSGLE